MSIDESKVWRARAAQMRALVDKAQGRISKELLLRIAEDYEQFAQSIEQRPDRFLPSPDLVPAEVRQYGHRIKSLGAAPSVIPDDDIRQIPDFLRQPRAPADEPSDDGR